MTEGAPAAPASCANCGAHFVPERRRFCPDCGQETRIKAPTLGEFAQQFGGAYFSTEGALWRTLGLLLFKPGELTRRYLAGRRKHYVLPLRLYLSISLIALLLMRTVAGVDIDQGIKFDFDPAKSELNLISFGDGRGAGIKDGKFYCTDLPAWVCTRLQRRLDVDPKGLEREAARAGERFLSNIGAAMFVMLPMFALWQKLVYWRRGLRYTEHLVFALHLHAFWFGALLLLLPELPWLGGAVAMLIPLYTLAALKRVYAGRWWPLLLRACLVSTLYALTLSIVLFLVLMWTLVF